MTSGLDRITYFTNEVSSTLDALFEEYQQEEPLVIVQPWHRSQEGFGSQSLTFRRSDEPTTHRMVEARITEKGWFRKRYTIRAVAWVFDADNGERNKNLPFGSIKAHRPLSDSDDSNMLALLDTAFSWAVDTDL